MHLEKKKKGKNRKKLSMPQWVRKKKKKNDRKP